MIAAVSWQQSSSIFAAEIRLLSPSSTQSSIPTRQLLSDSALSMVLALNMMRSHPMYSTYRMIAHIDSPIVPGYTTYWLQSCLNYSFAGQCSRGAGLEAGGFSLLGCYSHASVIFYIIMIYEHYRETTYDKQGNIINQIQQQNQYPRSRRYNFDSLTTDRQDTKAITQGSNSNDHLKASHEIGKGRSNYLLAILMVVVSIVAILGLRALWSGSPPLAQAQQL